MSTLYRCDECAEVAGADAAVGWVEVRALGSSPLRPTEPHHLCRLCWARTIAAAHAVRTVGGGEPQVSEHTQNRDTLQ